MKNIIYNLLWIITFAQSITSCYEDKGNYDYTPISTIEITGMEDNYSAISFEGEIHIPLTVTSSDPNDTFEYIWTIYNSNQDATTKGVRDTIGREKDLVFPVRLPQGDYFIQVEVTNKKNHYALYKTSKLEVSTVFSRGFYLLKETAEHCTEVDLLPVNNNNETSTPIPNLMGSAGIRIQMKPHRLNVLCKYCYLDTVTNKKNADVCMAVTSEKDIHIMRIKDMSLIYDHESMFFDQAPDEHPYFMWNNQNAKGLFYISNRGCYYNDQGILTRNMGKFSIYPVSIENNYILSEHCFYGSYLSNNVYLYDELNGRFLAITSAGNLVTGITTNNGLSSNNIPYKLRWQGKVALSNNAIGCAIFRDENTVPQKHYLYCFKINNTFTNMIESIDEIKNSMQFNSASLFTSNSSDARIIYFVANNKLYAYDIDSKTERFLEPEGMDINGEITYISHKTMKWYNAFKYLIIATYHDGEYSVYMYNTVGGIPSGNPQIVIKGTGKIKDLQYVAPEFINMLFTDNMYTF